MTALHSIEKPLPETPKDPRATSILPGLPSGSSLAAAVASWRESGERALSMTSEAVSRVQGRLVLMLVCPHTTAWIWTCICSTSTAKYLLNLKTHPSSYKRERTLGFQAAAWSAADVAGPGRRPGSLHAVLGAAVAAGRGETRPAAGPGSPQGEGRARLQAAGHWVHGRIW